MTKRVRYFCTHCGRSFEDEAKEIVECPGCFWSTSVKPEGVSESNDTGEGRKAASADSLKKSGGHPNAMKPFFQAIAVVLGAAVVIAGVYFMWLKSSSKESIKKPSRLTAVSIKAPGKDQNQTSQAGAAPNLLTEEEKTALNFDASASTKNIQPHEKEILDFRTDIKTGIVEALPSQAWTWEQFEEMLTNQEKNYKITLPRSYHKKLEKLFTQEYLAGSGAFEKGELLAARDFWIRALVFPLYSENLQKHRGVALTMLRPFTNDTLSKIGAINQSLVEKDFRVKEADIHRDYGRLFEIIKKQDWENGLNLIEEMLKKISTLESPADQELPAPAYPVEIQSVDLDIQRALYDILTVRMPSTADFEPLKTDLRKKREVIQGRIPKFTEQSRNFYAGALSKIRVGEWAGALDDLKMVGIPSSLRDDAEKKIRILTKLTRSS